MTAVADEVAGARQVPADDGDPSPHGSTQIGWLFAAVWLIYLVGPLQTAWAYPGPGWRFVAITALLVFAAGYCWVFIRWRVRRHAGGQHPPALVWSALVAGAVLIALAAPAARQDSLTGLIYLGVAAAMMLPLRSALAVLAVTLAAAVLLPRALPGWTDVDELVPELVLSAIAAYGVSQILLRNSQLREARQQRVELAIARERERLARDVHDILGHSLTVITVKAELTARLLESAGSSPALDRARAEIADLEDLARGALADVRATTSGTREISLAGELVAAREALRAAGVVAELPPTVEMVPVAHRQLFAWAVREGITNVVRHSGAARCVVRLEAGCVEVADDGRGPVGGGCGTGLAGLQARAAAGGARVEVGRAREGGFSLRVVAG